MDEINGFVGTDSPVFPDLDCAHDYAVALRLRGLEKRKRLAELSQYGCVKMSPWLYSVSTKETQTIQIENETVIAHRILGVLDHQVLGPMPDITTTWGEHVVIEGWILDEDLIRMTESELREELRRRGVSS
jgi:hypothetical protein